VLCICRHDKTITSESTKTKLGTRGNVGAFCPRAVCPLLDTSPTNEDQKVKGQGNRVKKSIEWPT